MRFEDILKEIKEKYSCLDVARDLGLQLRQVGSDEYRGVSIMPGEHKHDDGLWINTYRNSWYDHSGKIGGDVIDLVAMVKFGDKSRVVDAVKFLAGDKYDDAYGEQYTRERNTFLKQIEQWHKDIWHDEKVLDYLHQRRITDETIEQLKLGVGEVPMKINGKFTNEWRLTCPYIDEWGNVRYMASRQLSWAAHEGSPKYHKKQQNSFCRNLPFGLNSLPHKDTDCDILTIGEGMIDAISLQQEGYSILFSIGGAFGKDNEAIVLKHCKRFKKIITCYDIDGNEAGQRFTYRMGELLLREHINFYCVADYGENCKDVSDYYTAGGNLTELLNYRTINGYVFMAQMLASNDDGIPFRDLSHNDQQKRLEEVKKFLLALKAFADKETLQQVNDTLCGYYPENRITQYAQPMTEQEILCARRDKFLEARNLFHYGDGEHGEYWQYNPHNGAWSILKDIQAEISEFFNHELRNKDITALAMMVRLKVHIKDMPQFNSKRVFVFSNGTLELDTGIFREYRADDYSTMPHNFPYDVNAKCDVWDAFLQQVSAGEQTRINFLDDIPAYTLCEDHSQQKCFFLVGDGGNGKGVYLHTLERLFGCDNADSMKAVTAVEPAEMDKPTERIQLQGSILNISGEISTDLRKATKFIKSLTGGDLLSGNRKFHDTVYFKSRAKLVCSCNKIPRFEDADYATRRRLMFCAFTQRFTGKADIYLEDKLKAELSGIFNRVYRAYKTLRERMKTYGDNSIRQSIDQRELMNEFQSVSNPIYTFWLEYRESYYSMKKILKSAVFNDFKAFCERNSLFAGEERTFNATFFKTLIDLGVDVTNDIHSRDKDNRTIYFYVFNSKRPPEIATPNADASTSDLTVQAREEEQAKQETTEQQTHNDEGTTDSEDTTQGSITQEYAGDEIFRVLEAGRTER